MDSLGLVESFTTAITTMKEDYLVYVAAIVPIGLAIWAAPKVLGWAKRFFTSLSRQESCQDIPVWGKLSFSHIGMLKMYIE